MVDGGRGAMFPIVFFDGENEVNVGLVKIEPSLEYKAFQLLISQRIGISPNQITIYLVDRNKSMITAETRRRIPITGKANFSFISNVKNGSFLAVLKRSRKNRRSKPKPATGFQFSDDLQPAPQKFLVLQQRNSYFHQNPPPFLNYSDDLFLNSNNVSNMDLYFKSFPKIEDSFNVLASRASSIRSSCLECRNHKLSPADFHCCVDDTVIVGFRSLAGAVSRPPIKLSD